MPEDKRPPKKWWNMMTKIVQRKNPEYTKENVDRVVGSIWHQKMSPSKQKENFKEYETKKGLWLKKIQDEVKEKQEKESPTTPIWEDKVSSVLNKITAYIPPKDLFTQSAEVISNQLYKDSKDLKQAMSRLNFYMNRAGSNLSKERIKSLEKAKDLLRKMY